MGTSVRPLRYCNGWPRRAFASIGRATAPWTVPSHASIFTAQWPHDLGVNWDTPLNENFPTLAQYLGSRGYATAGFVANTMECSYDRGLSRGFTHYEDYSLEHLLPLRTAWLVDHFLQVVSDVGVFAGRAWDVGPFRPMQDSWVSRLFIRWPRKDAGSINRAFVDWLSQRREPGRPFLAFLNYYDAHAPYVLPAGAAYRFGLAPRSVADFIFLMEYWESIDKLTVRPALRRLAQDSYDNCVACLDQRLGELFDELRHRGVLDQTLVILTADHGEGFGEHALFDHGESLYRNEIGVPLLIALPASQRYSGVVHETVSLRDLPATILDLVNLCPGRPSRAGRWCASGVNRRPEQERSKPTGQSQTCQSPIRMIRIMADHQPIEDRSSPWPTATSFISATSATGPRNFSTSATIRVNYATSSVTQPRNPLWNDFASELGR